MSSTMRLLVARLAEEDFPLRSMAKTHLHVELVPLRDTVDKDWREDIDRLGGKAGLRVEAKLELLMDLAGLSIASEGPQGHSGSSFPLFFTARLCSCMSLELR